MRAPGTTASETRQILTNLKQLLESVRSCFDKIVKVNVLLHSMLEAPNMNEVYTQFFPDPPPARTVCGARLPDGMKVMIECTALAGPMSAGLVRTAIAPKNPLLNASRAGNLPHVPGIRIGNYLFLSGMVPVDPQPGERSHGPIAEQVRITLSNMQHMLESAGSSLDRVVRACGACRYRAHGGNGSGLSRVLSMTDAERQGQQLVLEASVASISASLRTRAVIGSTASDRAAVSNGPRKYVPPLGAVSGLNMIAVRSTRGAISLSNSNHLPPIVASTLINPVMLPPG
jgi:enamine deaminase RidA (YjgF/YER057c/UK114 family)